MISPSNNFTRSVWLTLGTLMLFFITVGFYSYSELQTKNAHTTQLRSFVLADELRQTSDDLTRMARLYVATGNPIYKDYYQEILDVRDGKAPRPVASDERRGMLNLRSIKIKARANWISNGPICLSKNQASDLVFNTLRPR